MTALSPVQGKIAGTEWTVLVVDEVRERKAEIVTGAGAETWPKLMAPLLTGVSEAGGGLAMIGDRRDDRATPGLPAAVLAGLLGAGHDAQSRIRAQAETGIRL